MEVNDLRAWVTAISLLLFLALVGWTWSRSRQAAFDEAALQPFADDAANEDGRAS